MHNIWLTASPFSHIFGSSVGKSICPECRVSWVQIPPEATHFFFFHLPKVSFFLSLISVLSCIVHDAIYTFCISKIIHVHLDLTLVWNDRKCFYLAYNCLFCVCQISVHCFIIDNHVLTLWHCDIKLYTIFIYKVISYMWKYWGFAVHRVLMN